MAVIYEVDASGDQSRFLPRKFEALSYARSISSTEDVTWVVSVYEREVAEGHAARALWCLLLNGDPVRPALLTRRLIAGYRNGRLIKGWEEPAPPSAQPARPS